ncbi:MAG: alpha/beta fold hydrolase [Pseudomonadales bacterium]|nr:alpha/beta fold hydrolase [Pseudomonadales bacterium]
MSELLDHILLEPSAEARATVIWLHGLGADGHDFEPIVPELNLPESSGIRFIFPHAPVRPVTINGGAEMRAWYDFTPHSESGSTADIEASAEAIRAFIRHENEQGIPTEKIVLAGFSQGGVIALYTALRHTSRLAGVVALSTYLHDFRATEAERTDANLAIPILMAHGTYDPMIPIMQAATSRENLIRLGYDVRWLDYPMEHQVCLEEIEEIAWFLQEVL